MIDYRGFAIRPVRIIQPLQVERGLVTPFVAGRPLRFGYVAERLRDEAIGMTKNLVFSTVEAAKEGVDCLIDASDHHHGDMEGVAEYFMDAWYADDSRGEHRKLSRWSDAGGVLWFASVAPEYPSPDEEVEYLPLPDAATCPDERTP